MELNGSGISRVGEDVRRLTVNARDSEGRVGFAHRSPTGVSRFKGVVTCFEAAPGGTVQLSGEVTEGETASGMVLTGQDFAFTLEAGEGDQSFSLPRFDGDLAGCSGGRPPMVPVTEGGFHLR